MITKPTCGRWSAFVLAGVLAFGADCFAQPLPFCPGSGGALGPAKGAPTLQKPFVLEVPAARTEDEFTSAIKLDRALAAVSQEKWKAKGIDPGKTRSLSLQDKKILFDDVNAALADQAGKKEHVPTEVELQNAAKAIAERDWIAANKSRIDSRILGSTLKGDSTQVSGRAFLDKTTDIAALALAYRGTPSRDKLQLNAPWSSELTALLARHPESSQVMPGTEVPSHGLQNVAPHTPVVFKDGCLRKADKNSWGVKPDSNTLDVAYDAAGFQDVAMLLHPDGVAGGNSYTVCSLAFVAPGIAVSAAHCTHLGGALGIAAKPGLYDPAQYLVLVPIVDAGQLSRNPTACFAKGFDAASCSYYIAVVSQRYSNKFNWLRESAGMSSSTARLSS